MKFLSSAILFKRTKGRFKKKIEKFDVFSIFVEVEKNVKYNPILRRGHSTLRGGHSGIDFSEEIRWFGNSIVGFAGNDRKTIFYSNLQYFFRISFSTGTSTVVYQIFTNFEFSKSTNTIRKSIYAKTLASGALRIRKSSLKCDLWNKISKFIEKSAEKFKNRCFFFNFLVSNGILVTFPTFQRLFWRPFDAGENATKKTLHNFACIKFLELNFVASFTSWFKIFKNLIKHEFLQSLICYQGN